MKRRKQSNITERKFIILTLLTAQIDLATSTLHWFAQIGDDFTSIDDDGGGKRFLLCMTTKPMIKTHEWVFQ